MKHPAHCLNSLRHKCEYVSVQKIYSSYALLYFLLLCNPDWITLFHNCSENVERLAQGQQLTSC